MKKFLKKKQGFTLVELMVVVAVMGILVLVAIPSYNAATAKVEAGVCETNRRTIKSAITQYEALESDPQDLGGKSSDQNGEGDLAELLKDYFDGGVMPRCPGKGFTGYTVTQAGSGYVVECSVHKEAAQPEIPDEP